MAPAMALLGALAGVGLWAGWLQGLLVAQAPVPPVAVSISLPDNLTPKSRYSR